MLRGSGHPCSNYRVIRRRRAKTLGRRIEMHDQGPGNVQSRSVRREGAGGARQFLLRTVGAKPIARRG